VNTTTIIVAIVVFLALDILFYYLIIKSMERPSPSAAFARSRNLSMVPDSEGASVGARLRERLPIPRGELLDIVTLVIPGGEGYLFTTLPDADSHLPKARENQRQFVAVFIDTGADGGLFIHPPIRFPLLGYKERRLFRVFKAGTFSPVPKDLLPAAMARRYRMRAEHPRPDLARLLTPEVANLLTIRAPRERGFALIIRPVGLVVYINPLVKDRQEAEKFCDFAAALAAALAKEERQAVPGPAGGQNPPLRPERAGFLRDT